MGLVYIAHITWYSNQQMLRLIPHVMDIIIKSISLSDFADDLRLVYIAHITCYIHIRKC